MIFVLREYYSGKEFIIASICFILAFLISITVHEFAHAFSAVKQGDDTPKYTGRYTLNPFSHIDPIGFLCSVLFFFGWAKPVKVNPTKFKKPRKGMALVSCSGVIANLILAFISCGIYMAMFTFITTYSNFVVIIINFFYILFSINISLAVFNFLPFAPLDGFNFLCCFTKPDNKVVRFLASYGYLILLIILTLFSNFLGILIDTISYPMIAFWGWIF